MLLQVSSVSKSFGIDIVLENVSFKVARRQKCAIVGRNGTGKTTLIKLISGAYEPDSGSILLGKGVKIGYLKQENSVTEGLTVLQEAQSAQQEQLRIKAHLEMLETRMANSPTPEELEEYAMYHEHFIEAEGYSLDHDARTVLLKMGFAEDEFSKPTSVLSGGEKTRLALARLLLEEPDLLILDEPTNHLDLQATEWLERWITSYHGAVLLVSHDRVFLENTAETFFDLRGHSVKTYTGNFTQYQKLREEEEARLAVVVAKQEEEIAKLDEFVRRFMNSQRTAQARGRLKQMTKLQEQKLDGPAKESGMAGGFAKTKRSGDIVLECSNLIVGFEGIPLFPKLDWTVSWGERWGIIGENGAGKSTLIKSAIGELEQLGGNVKLGSNVNLGYFHQDVTDLDPEMSPLEYLVYEAGMDTAPARDLLGRFLFSGEDVMRPVRTLSGGEKNKLVLAKLTQLNPNLLILDEPTNHLDMDSRDALAKVLLEYKGTLILISHDRWLLSQVTNKTLDVRRSGAIQYPGGYDDYRTRTSPAAITTQAIKKAVDVPAHPVVNARQLSKDIQKQEKLVQEIEEQVTSTEKEIQQVETELANLPPTADVFELSRRHQWLVEQLESNMSAWEQQTRKLEELKAMQGPADHVPGVAFRTNQEA